MQILFTLSHLIGFWDLNSSLGCSPHAAHAYRGLPFPDFYDAKTFGVGQGTDPFRSLSPQSVSLPLPLSQSRLDCGLYWQEPAITALDWLFTPSPRLEDYLLVSSLQASTRFYPRFTLPRVRSSGFGSDLSDLWHFHTMPLVNCGQIAFASASHC